MACVVGVTQVNVNLEIDQDSRVSFLTVEGAHSLQVTPVPQLNESDVNRPIVRSRWLEDKIFVIQSCRACP